MLDQIKSKLAEAREAIQTFPWENKMACGAFLSQAYYYVSHSTRLLVFAASKFDLENEPVHRRLVKHAMEELSHEVLAERDLKHLGLKAEDFGEFTSTQALYQTQYGMIHSRGPWSIFGYILALEVLSMEEAGNIANEIRKHHGDKTNTFAKVHAADDIEHVERALEVLEKTDESTRAIIMANLETSAYLIQKMFEQCRNYGLKSKKRVA